MNCEIFTKCYHTQFAIRIVRFLLLVDDIKLMHVNYR